jgi:hypothetical protein
MIWSCRKKVIFPPIYSMAVNTCDSSNITDWVKYLVKSSKEWHILTSILKQLLNSSFFDIFGSFLLVKGRFSANLFIRIGRMALWIMIYCYFPLVYATYKIGRLKHGLKPSYKWQIRLTLMVNCVCALVWPLYSMIYLFWIYEQFLESILKVTSLS